MRWGVFFIELLNVNIIQNITFFPVITNKILSSYLWSLFSRMDSLLPFHWWVKVMYLIYWRKLILKTPFCYHQQRFIHRIMLLILLLSGFWNILKLQSTFTNIKTLGGLELQPTYFRRKCGFSLFRYLIKSNTRIFPDSNPIHGV